MKQMRRWAALALVLAVALIAGCSGGQQPAEPTAQQPAQQQPTETPSGEPSQPAQPAGPKPGGIIVVAKDDEAPGLDPHKMPAHAAIRVFELIYESLVRLDANMAIQPSLAENWEISDDGTTYTFKLRQGVKFHNGREMTSADVKFSYERMLKEETGALVRSFFAPVIDSIETPDGYTVIFRLKAPNAPFLHNVASYWAAIVPQEVVEQNSGDLSRVAVGTGPFTLGEWVQDNYTMLHRFDDYWGDKPLVDGVKFVVMKDEAARVAAIRTGQVHMTPITAQSAQLLKNEAGVEVLSAAALRYYYLGLNHAVEPLDNLKVRQAIALAVDRQQLIDVVFNGEAVLTGPTPPGLTEWAVPGDQFPLNQTDLDKARQLLKEAGYENGFTVKLTSATSRADFQDLAQLIQAQLGQIGIKVEIEAVEWAAYVDTWRKKGMEMMVGSNGGATDIDRSLHFYWATEGGANVWNFSNPTFDQLIDQARREPDPEKRKGPYAEAQELVVDQVANLFLLSNNRFLAIRDTVQDYLPMPNEQNLYLSQTWLSE